MPAPTHFILIDDEMCSNKISKTFIRTMYPNAEVVESVSPFEALQYIRHHFTVHIVATVVLLDINMPRLNGW